MKRAIPGAGFSLITGLPFLAVGMAIGLVLHSLPMALTSWDMALLIGVGALLWVSVYVTLCGISAKGIEPKRASYSIVLAVWWFLLVDEDIFVRHSPIEGAFEGNFPLAAYGEVILWVLACAILCIVSLRRARDLVGIFSGSEKWLWIFALVCILSVKSSPRPIFSLAWAFKLFLIVWLLRICSIAFRDYKDILTFLRVTLSGFGAVIGVALGQVVWAPAGAFKQGRLAGLFDPTNISEKGGIVLLLSLVFYSLERRKWLMALALLGGTVMVLGGGKAAIAAAIISGALFFLMQKKVGSAFALVAGVCMIGSLALFVTPIGTYLRSYEASGKFSTLTGRTRLWMASWGAIKESPIAGHGYMASKFVSLQVQGISWEAGHMHNAFLEVLYNNGLLGLIPILLMNVIVLRNLIQIMREKRTREGYLLAVGLLAIYIDLLIDGSFRVTFGGRPYGFFMLFLALVVLSGKLKTLTGNLVTANQLSHL